MSRKANRDSEVVVTSMHDAARAMETATGLSINGRDPLVAEGDVRERRLHVHCACRSPEPVAWLVRIERSPRGLGPLWVLQRQRLVDPDARPVGMAVEEVVARQGAVLDADCAAHGPQQVKVDELLKKAHRQRETKVGRFDLSRRVAGRHSL